MSNNILIFTYGTLMKGYRHYKLIQHTKFVTEAKITGVDMYENLSFPMLVYGTGEYLGEVYEVDADTLKNLDKIKCYSEGFEDSMYLREPIIVKTKDDKVLEVQFYRWNDKFYTLPTKRVKSGTKWKERG